MSIVLYLPAYNDGNEYTIDRHLFTYFVFSATFQIASS